MCGFHQFGLPDESSTLCEECRERIRRSRGTLFYRSASWFERYVNQVTDRVRTTLELAGRTGQDKVCTAPRRDFRQSRASATLKLGGAKVSISIEPRSGRSLRW